MDPKEILDKFLKLPTPIRAGILVGLYVVIVMIYYVGFYTEGERELEKKKAAYEQLHTKLVQTQNIASQIDTFIEEVEQLKEQLAQAQDQLPPDPRVDLLMHLDMAGICASSGSACKTGDPKPSAILETIGLGPAWTTGGLRFTVGSQNSPADIKHVIQAMPSVVEKVRKVSQLFTM